MAEREQFERWYRWAGVPVGTMYPEADRMVSDAVSRLEADRDALASALREIADYPVGNPTAEFKLRLIASQALAEAR